MNRIKELRKEKKITQKVLAESLNINQRNIDRWENEKNEPSSSALIQLADFFECSIDYLLGREDDFSNVQTNSDLSNEEREILAIFNSLKPNNKQFFLEFVRRMNAPSSIEQLNSNTKKEQNL